MTYKELYVKLSTFTPDELADDVSVRVFDSSDKIFPVMWVDFYLDKNNPRCDRSYLIIKG